MSAAPPDPPENVRLVFADGLEVPVQTALVEIDGSGIAVWEVVDAPPGLWTAVKVGVLPPRCSISVPMSEQR